MDPYGVLGVSPTASRAEVTEAYRTMVQIFHPDRHHSSPEAVRAAAEARMKELNEAYTIVRRGLPAPRRGDGDGVGGARPSGIANIRSAALWVGTMPGSWARTARRSGTPGPTRRLSTPESRRRVAQVTREIDAQSRMARELREQAQRSVTHGVARPRPKQRVAQGSRRSVLTGLGRALHTDELTCTGCRSLQRLPGGWRARLDDTEYLCSACGRVVLSR